MTPQSTNKDFRQHQAQVSEALFQNAIVTLGLTEEDAAVVLFYRPKGTVHWLPAEQSSLSHYDEHQQDMIVVGRHNNAFGQWFEITEHSWQGSVNQGAVHVGVGVIDGALYQLDESALFYGEDFEPYWSPVVHADTKEVSAIFQKITGKAYPVMTCDGTDPVAWNYMLKQKEQAGFLYHEKEQSFAHVNVFRFDSELHKQVYLTIAKKAARDTPDTLAGVLVPVVSRLRPELTDWLESEAGRHIVSAALSHLHVLPDNALALQVNQQISEALSREQALREAQAAKQRQSELPKDAPPAVHFYHGGKAWYGDFELNAKKNGGMEHGPGLYLTNGIETARNYAKGGGVVQRIAVRADARLLKDKKCSADDMIDFVKRNSVRNYKKVISDIERNAEKMGSRHIDLEVLINLMINNDSLKPSVAPALNEFIVSNGVDISVFNAPMWTSHGGGNDQWVVVFNPKVVLSKTKVDMKQFDWRSPRLPTYEEQLASLPLPEPIPAVEPTKMAQRR